MQQQQSCHVWVVFCVLDLHGSSCTDNDFLIFIKSILFTLLAVSFLPAFTIKIDSLVSPYSIYLVQWWTWFLYSPCTWLDCPSWFPKPLSLLPRCTSVSLADRTSNDLPSKQMRTLHIVHFNVVSQQFQCIFYISNIKEKFRIWVLQPLIWKMGVIFKLKELMKC